MDLKSLESLGITKESLIDRIVEKCVEDLMTDVSFDEDDNSWRNKSSIARKLDERIKTHIDEAVARLANTHVLPNVATYIETLTLNETNKWGEKKGQKVTFIEYLVQRADAYMRDEVNSDGKSKDENAGGYSWSKSTTRIAHMVDKHLYFSIDTAMRQAMGHANSSIAKGLEEAMKISLTNATQKLKVAVSV
jgi:hypothetical protein